jgi:tetratricopeptide (TPR) repeat protein
MRVETDFRRETQRLERNERDKYSSFLLNLIRMEGKPKVAILDVVGPRLDNPVEYGHEDPLNASVDYYHSKIDRAQFVRVLKYYTVYLMQQARKTTEPDKQLFLIFKAVEFARMIVQYAPFAIHADAEALVFGVFHDLGDQRPGQFRRYIEAEQSIFSLMKKLHFSPVDNDTRIEMAEQMVRQSSYFDAMAQYQFLLTRYPRIPQEADLPRARVSIQIAEIFQGLVEYAEGGPEEFRDARKLRNFIDRYNRDYASRKRPLPRILRPDRDQIARAVRGLREEANHWYQRALAVRLVGPRMVTRLVSQLAENYLKDGKNKDALNVLNVGYSYWRRVPEAIETIEQRIEYLNLMISVGSKLKRRDTVNFANQEVREFQNRLTERELLRAAEEKRREAMFEEEEEMLT